MGKLPLPIGARRPPDQRDDGPRRGRGGGAAVRQDPGRAAREARHPRQQRLRWGGDHLQQRR